MKLLLLLLADLCDGPAVALGGRTPLESALVPNMDRIVREGRLGTVRWGAGEGAGDAAPLTLLGYDPAAHRARRGYLDALGAGVTPGPDDLCLCLNFVSTFRGRLADPSAGRVGNVEARLLVQALQDALGGDRYAFHPALRHRNVLLVRGGARWDLETVSARRAMGRPLDEVAPRGEHADALRALMADAQRVLARHDVNQVRVDLGENPADSIWPWGGGRATEVEPFALRHGRSLAIVGAVPVVRGVRRLVEAKGAVTRGATGGADTDLGAKVQAALGALERFDVVLLHVAAVSEPTASGDVRRKVKVVEDLDRLVVGPVVTALRRRGDARLLLTTDHGPPLADEDVEGDVPRAPGVPWALWGPGVAAGRGARFDERTAALGDLHVDAGHGLLEYALANEPARPGRPLETLP